MLNKALPWAVTVSLCCNTTFADVIWSEAVDGDLSNDIANPTSVVLVSSEDQVVGEVGGPNPGEFFDAFTFAVPFATTLVGINLDDYVAQSKNIDSRFELYIGSDATGTALTSIAAGAAEIGQNTIADAVLGGPLPADSYTYVIREIVPGQQYQLGIQLGLVENTIWNELIDGDLSNDQSAPTIVFPFNASNLLAGTVGGADPGEFFDQFFFKVPIGYDLQAIRLVDYVGTVGNASTSTTFYQGIVGGGPAPLAIQAINADGIGNNIVESAGVLGPGFYTMDIQETTPGQRYGFDIEFGSTAFWNEISDGPLSDDPAQPTTLTLPLGESLVAGTFLNGEPVDALTFAVPAGLEVSDISLVDYTARFNPNSNFSLYEGAAGDAGLLVASEDFGPEEIGLSLFETNLPLTDSNYSLVISEETGGQQYTLQFTVSELATNILFSDGFEAL